VVGEERLHNLLNIRLRRRLFLAILVNEALDLLVLLSAETVVELEAEAELPAIEVGERKGQNSSWSAPPSDRAPPCWRARTAHEKLSHEFLGREREKGTNLAKNVLQVANVLVAVVLMRVPVLDRVRLVLLGLVLLRDRVDFNARLKLRETHRTTLQRTTVSVTEW
jgi:hypothetical protein